VLASLELHEMQRRQKARELAIDLFRDAIIYLIFVTLYTVLVVYSQAGGEDAFMWRSQLDDTIFQEEFPESDSHVFRGFASISAPLAFWQWMEGVFVTQVFPDSLPDGEPYKIIFTRYNRLIGAVRLRQNRVGDSSCSVSVDYSSTIKNCYAEFSAAAQTTDAYGNSGPGFIWKSAGGLASGNTDMRFWSFFQTYPGDGYAVDLFGNVSTVTQQLQTLRANNWVDLQTRAVTLDMALLNEALKVHGVIRVVFEFLPTGGVLPSRTIRVLKLDKYANSETNRGVMAAEVILILFIMWYSFDEVRELRREGWKEHFTDMWNAFDIVNISLFIVVIALRSTTVYLFLQLQTADEAKNHYVNFQTVGFLTQQEMNWNAINAFLCFWKIFKYIQAIPAVGALLQTMHLAAKDMLFFMIIFMITLLGFVMSGYFAFGLDLLDFRTIPQVFFSLMRGINGDLDFDALYETNRIFGPIYYFAFFIIIFYILMTMFLAIINMAYDMAQGQKKASNLDFNFIAAPLSSAWTNIKTCCGACGDEQEEEEEEVVDVVAAAEAAQVAPRSMEDAALMALKRKRPGVTSQLAAQLAAQKVSLSKHELAYVDEMVTQRMREIEERHVINAVIPNYHMAIDDRLERLALAVSGVAERFPDAAAAGVQSPSLGRSTVASSVQGDSLRVPSAMSPSLHPTASPATPETDPKPSIVPKSSEPEWGFQDDGQSATTLAAGGRRVSFASDTLESESTGHGDHDVEQPQPQPQPQPHPQPHPRVDSHGDGHGHSHGGGGGHGHSHGGGGHVNRNAGERCLDTDAMHTMENHYRVCADGLVGADGSLRVAGNGGWPALPRSTKSKQSAASEPQRPSGQFEVGSMAARTVDTSYVDEILAQRMREIEERKGRGGRGSSRRVAPGSKTELRSTKPPVQNTWAQPRPVSNVPPTYSSPHVPSLTSAVAPAPPVRIDSEPPAMTPPPQPRGRRRGLAPPPPSDLF